ncbi:Ketoacyl-synthetase C-terminal extension [Nonomuraea solani]|uniref:Ketoacyl-synthetase C-terminal extension n=1 Tax=Nonomuraea solani TaxID=1144553 RepID=A0A1H6EET6_9ACTN|nr:polyketide synthase [Nonomuraea solani]SEG95476.1 Ketoacyl-synthetase C-terminal extension [Nonomuraea solani]
MDAQTVATPVAIIGMSCRVAGAENVRELWNLLGKGTRMVAPIPPERVPGLDHGDVPVGTPRAALIPDVGGFDADFFGISRRMAAWTDPQQRMFLELAWHAVEDAAVNPESLKGRPVAVFAGTCMTDYRERMGCAGAVDSGALPGALTTFIPNRVSYHFGLTGPSTAIDSACSSGLTALGLAVRGLQAGDFPMALVGAANVICQGFYASTAYRAGALSPTGESVPFSACHDGYVRGEGGACVLIKPLPDALRDGDPIRAVIRGVELGHDGQAGGLTGTDAESQARLITRAARAAGVPVRSIGHLEAHGTGTGGDAVEVEGLRRALTDGASEDRAGGPEGKVWIGSVKANIGHLEPAAGLIGLVKAALVLAHGRIPRIAGLDAPDPGIDLTGAPMAIADHDVAWPPSDSPRRAGVNSFGLGGALAHVLIEEPPAPPDQPRPDGPLVFPLSAATPSALRRLAGGLREVITAAGTTADTAAGTVADAAVDVAAVAWTLQHGRAPLAVRRAVVADDLEGLGDALGAIAADTAHPAVATPETESPRALDRLGGEQRSAVASWLDGGATDWAQTWPGREPSRVALAPYPFERRPHWFKGDPHPIR